MTGSKDDLSDEELERIWQRYQDQHGGEGDFGLELMRREANNPRYNAVLQQTIRLKGDEKLMDFGSARVALLMFREIQANNPNQFAELVRSVKPKGATQLPKPSVQLAITRGGLKKKGILTPDGLGVHPGYAAVLNAAYTETNEGVILRDAVIPPSKDFVEELIAAEKEVDCQIILAAQREITEGDRGKGNGHSR